MVSTCSQDSDAVSSSSSRRSRRVIKFNGKRSGEESMKKLKKPAMVHAAVVAVAEDEKLDAEALKSGWLFRRTLFSEDDEILLLQRMMEHKNGNDPSTTLYDFVKSDLPFTVKQVYRKRKGLREKFFKNIKKGKDVSFDNAHEKLIFDLSKKIWSFQQYAGAAADQPKKKHRRLGSSSTAAAPLQLCFTELLRTKDLRFNEELIRQGMELLSKKVTLKFERKWKSLIEAEAELFHKRVLLFAETAKLTLEAYKASGN